MTHFCLTVGGANYGTADTVGRAMGGYATSGGRHRKVVTYSQAMTDQAFDDGLAQLTNTIRDTLRSGEHTIELLGTSMGSEIISQWLDENADKPDAPSPLRLVRITTLANPCRRYGGVWNGLLSRFGYGSRRRRSPTPATQYLHDDVARVRDGWCNADAWAVPPLKKPSKLALMIGKSTDHRDYSRVNLTTAKLRQVDGNMRYWVHA